MDRELARRISDLMLQQYGALHESVGWVREACTADELQQYKRAVGTVLTDMLIELMWPIYRLHPDLTPDGLRVPRVESSCATHGRVGFSSVEGEVQGEGQGRDSPLQSGRRHA